MYCLVENTLADSHTYFMFHKLIFRYFISASLDDFNIKFLKNPNILPLLSLYKQQKIMSSILQEEDSQNRGKNTEKINKKMYMYLI